MVFTQMAELVSLLENEIPESKRSLQDSHSNLERVAEYCEGNYFQAQNKRAALEETKNYTTQSLASVAYQINTLAYNFLQMLDLQTTQLEEMEAHINNIAQLIMIHKEKVARREIGVLTTNKATPRQYKITAPANPERPIKYVRKPIDYTILDEVGHGVKMTNTPRTRRTTQPPPVQAAVVTAAAQSAPPPTTKPPTPPQPVRAMGTLSKGSREYRALAPPVAPPQVPSNYAPNYPIGHPKSQDGGRKQSIGYGTLPLPGHNQIPNMQAPQGTVPQIGMVHPMAHAQHSMSNMGPMMNPASPLQQHDVMNAHMRYNSSVFISAPPTPPPPPPVMNSSFECPGNVSPPLPPPPSDDEHGMFMASYQPRSAAAYNMGRQNENKEWIPKNYLEKVVAIYDYHADKEDELSFSENSVIYVIKKNDDGWYEGVVDGITGLFPGNYVEPCM